LWAVAIAGLCLGGAGFLIASRNADQPPAFAERTKPASVLMTQKSEINDHLADVSKRLNPPEQPDLASLSARQTELQQSVARLEKTFDRMGADANKTSELSSARLGAFDKHLSEMEARLEKIEAVAQKRLPQEAPLAAPTSAVASPSQAPAAASSAADTPTPADDDLAAKAALSRYSVVSIGKHSARLSGPEGIVDVSPGDALADGLNVMKISNRHGKMRVVTNHGVIAAQAKK
jgi:hypothetical protein